MGASVDSSVETYEKLHLRDLLVHLLHKLYYKVHQLVFQHFLSMEIGDQERDVIALSEIVSKLLGNRAENNSKPCQAFSVIQRTLPLSASRIL